MLAVAALASGVWAGLPAAQVAPYDLVLRNARIVDGTGSPWFRADVGIRGDTIARIAPSIDGPASRTIDVGQQVVAPGFIDIHSHAARGIFEIPTADNYVRQGVTTLIDGPDGSSPVPLAPFLAKLEALRKSVNVGAFIGQGSIRSEVIGEVNRTAKDDELQKMRELVEQGMKDGAFGLSTGLFYVPGTFTPTDEVVELAKVAGRFGGIHVSHMRDETARVLDSVNETIAIGERGGLPTQVTHHKIIGRPNWGKSAETLQAVDAPGRAASTSRSTCIRTPPRARVSRAPSCRRGRRRAVASRCWRVWATRGRARRSRQRSSASSRMNAAVAIRGTSSSPPATGTTRWRARTSARLRGAVASPAKGRR